MNTFDELNLNETLRRNVAKLGYLTPTPIQAQAIPPLLAGRDLIGCAQTGTGKTAAFGLPMLQHLSEQPRPRERGACRALILTPTRELAEQIDQNLTDYGRDLGIAHVAIYGGVGYGPQIKAARAGAEIVVATPGRLLDLVGQRHLRLDRVELLVLDEADRMLDMGFIHAIRKILAELPEQRQTAFFSATLGPAARRLADGILTDPAQAAVSPNATPVDEVEQQLVYIEPEHKRDLLRELLAGDAVERALVFCGTKHGANRLAEHLARQGFGAEAIHGNKSQGQRQRSLDRFRDGRVKVLVATDVAARGIDIDGISHVINYDLPHEPEGYVHRIGRTARAGAAGTAISFCSYPERTLLRDIEKLIRQQIPVTETAKSSLAPVPRATPARRSGIYGGRLAAAGMRRGR